MFKKSLSKISIKSIFNLILLIVSIFLFYKISPVLAGELFSGEEEAVQAATGLSDASLSQIIGNIINIVLGLLGIVLVGLMVYAGILWMTASGENEQVGKAKKILKNSVIGLAIVLSSWAIASFVVNALNDAANDTGGSGGYSSGAVYGGNYSNLHGGALGKIIQTHYPDRDDSDVARNTKIFISFYEPIDINSIQTADGLVNTDVIKIYVNSDQEDYEVGSEDALTNVSVEISEDKKTIRLTPQDYLGSPSETMDYVVYLDTSIQRLSGGSVFVDGGFYFWRFTTSTIIDENPPRVLSVSPIDPAEGCLGGCHARNKMVQVTFNEAVDPLTVSGSTDNAFNNIILGEGLDVSGSWYSANNYLMAVFVPDSLCDGVSENSCGDPVFCLPANSEFNNTIRAATLSEEGSSAALFPYDGVVDLAGNSLDGNGNDLAEGKVVDDYTWLFTTNDKMKVTPPRVNSVSPNINAEEVSPDSDLNIEFSSALLATTIDKSVEVYEAEYNSDGVVEPLYRWNGPQRILLDENNKNILVWEHFLDFNVAPEEEDSFIFVSRVLSKLQDEYQNCYKPAQAPGCTTSDWKNGPWDQGTSNGVFPVCDRAQD